MNPHHPEPKPESLKDFIERSLSEAVDTDRAMDPGDRLYNIAILDATDFQAPA